MHVYDGHRKKLDTKAWLGILVGYDPQNARCYRVYDPTTGKVHRSVHVTFDETRFPAKKGAICDDESEDDEVEPQQEPIQPVGDIDAGADEVERGDDSDSKGAGEEKEDPPTTTELEGGATRSVGAPLWKWSSEVENRTGSLGRSVEGGRSVSRRSTKGQHHHAHVSIHQAFVSAEAATGDPSSYKEALESPDAANWQKAMDEEFGALDSNGTWTLCEKPSGANVMDVHTLCTVRHAV